MDDKKVVLAYSGGLDTSCILKWLAEKGFRVIAYIGDVGQKEDFEKAKEKALTIGAEKVYIEDLKTEFVEQYVFEALKANAVYEGKYLLGTSLARPVLAKKQVDIARKEGASFVAHGATGKGNDQVRFELTYAALMPEIKVIAPWKDPEFLARFKGRTDLIHYAREKGIPVESTLEKPYSIDQNLMHISFEAGILEDPSSEAPEEMFKKTVSPREAPDAETVISIEFQKGVPTVVTNETTGKTAQGSLELFTYLDHLAGENGIGRVDLVENRFVGIKSRGVYESPAATVLLKAHLDLEGITLDREVAHLKDQLMPKVAELIYNGFWFSPEMKFLMAAVNQSQENVNGRVRMKLYKGNASVVSRQSENSLYDADLSSMDKPGGYDQTDAKGFIALQALRLKLWKKR
ncbi:MAG TPA: argininosuccinate synthase [Candidatus Norongarragalinales archaeon]|nr:argininosuccinate synthase [Candidatus Norongarragalinales archaeon]